MRIPFTQYLEVTEKVRAIARSQMDQNIYRKFRKEIKNEYVQVRLLGYVEV